MSAMCAMLSPDSEYRCTRFAGHDGPHGYYLASGAGMEWPSIDRVVASSHSDATSGEGTQDRLAEIEGRLKAEREAGDFGEFTLHAPDDVAWLCAKLRSARQEIEALRRAVANYESCIGEVTTKLSAMSAELRSSPGSDV